MKVGKLDGQTVKLLNDGRLMIRDRNVLREMSNDEIRRFKNQRLQFLGERYF